MRREGVNAIVGGGYRQRGVVDHNRNNDSDDENGHHHALQHGTINNSRSITNDTVNHSVVSDPPLEPHSLSPPIFSWLPAMLSWTRWVKRTAYKQSRYLLQLHVALAILLLSVVIFWMVQTRYTTFPIHFDEEEDDDNGMLFFSRKYADSNKLGTGDSEHTLRVRSSSLLHKKPFGVNVIGYLTSSFGIAEASRSTAMALYETKNLGYEVPISLTMQKGREWLPQTDHTLRDNFGLKISDTNPYIFSIVHDDIHDDIAKKLHRDWNYVNSYRIGVWNWELNNTPDLAHRQFRSFDEVWVPSSYCAEPFMSSAPQDIPVIFIPYVVDMDKFYRQYMEKTFSKDTSGLMTYARQRFDIPEDTYVFLFQFDMYSCYERKNPFAPMHAFLRAFESHENAILIMKSMHATEISEVRTVWAMLENENKRRIIFMDDELPVFDSFLLKASANCLVSLHHSEGFGFNIAEAMYLGKPVITTAYSSNVDFMTTNITYPVKYELVEIERDTCKVYHRGNHWAKPDIGHAAERMRYVFDHQEEAAALGERASQYIKENNSPKAVGKVMVDRLAHIYTKILYL